MSSGTFAAGAALRQLSSKVTNLLLRIPMTACVLELHRYWTGGPTFFSTELQQKRVFRQGIHKKASEMARSPNKGLWSPPRPPPKPRAHPPRPPSSVFQRSFGVVVAGSCLKVPGRELTANICWSLSDAGRPKGVQLVPNGHFLCDAKPSPLIRMRCCRASI